VTPRGPFPPLPCWDSVSAGDRHVCRPRQGAWLRDDGALRQEEPQHGSHGRGPGGHQGTGNGAGLLRFPEDASAPGVAPEVWVSGVGSPGAEPWRWAAGARPRVRVPACFGVCPVGLISILAVPPVPPPTSHPLQSQGALAGRLRSFSMQDLRSIPDETPVHYRDPLYLEEQESHRQLLGELRGGSQWWWGA